LRSSLLSSRKRGVREVCARSTESRTAHIGRPVECTIPPRGSQQGIFIPRRPQHNFTPAKCVCQWPVPQKQVTKGRTTPIPRMIPVACRYDNQMMGQAMPHEACKGADAVRIPDNAPRRARRRVDLARPYPYPSEYPRAARIFRQGALRRATGRFHAPVTITLMRKSRYHLPKLF
jgi:hypothetical protein